MKNKYIVVDSNGNEHDPKKFAECSDCSVEFKIVIEREALGISSSGSDQSPEYISNANKLGFSWEQNSGQGFLQSDYNGQLIIELVQRYSRQLVNGLGIPIYEVRGSNFFDKKHPVVEAYANLFGDRLFYFDDGKKGFVMSYDGSYPQFNLAKRYDIKEDQLPFAHFSIADCYRYEQKGECMLLFRQRRFFMPDLHPYCKDVNEAWSLYEKIEQKILEAGDMVNIDYWNIAKVSSEDNWNKYNSNIKEIAVRRNKPLLVEIHRGGVDRYWIIDIDYSFVDKLNQVREIGCIQIDIGNASRLEIEYRDKAGVVLNPVIIHAAVPGGIERFIYSIIDDPKKRMPYWLHPVQLRLLPVSQKFHKFADELVKIVSNFPLRIEIDDRAESVSKKIRQAYSDNIPEFIVLGDREVQSKQELLNKIRDLSLRNNGFPYLSLSIPYKMSQRF